MRENNIKHQVSFISKKGKSNSNKKKTYSFSLKNFKRGKKKAVGVITFYLKVSFFHNHSLLPMISASFFSKHIAFDFRVLTVCFETDKASHAARALLLI